MRFETIAGYLQVTHHIFEHVENLLRNLLDTQLGSLRPVIVTFPDLAVAVRYSCRSLLHNLSATDSIRESLRHRRGGFKRIILDNKRR